MNIQFPPMASRTAFPSAAVSLPPTVVLTEQDPAIRYGGPGTWNSEFFSAYYDGQGKYNQTQGAWYEITVPAGYTRVVFAGIDITSGATYAVTLNGNPFTTGVQYSAGSGQMVYAELPGLTGGDVVRLTSTDANPSHALFADRITFTTT
ncbi:hypothetical protein JAO73_10535 [Hymenobacter sp. BT523]|uniref:hypothetical protein n=1 Tax=Hymenobacter sp. BT523 TaxID=2795725 RepID=UPI0018EB57D5|nr:hypothetical protein [Hymenobacter sp. BT523]MBJ6109452.1 hypothetical protein [Hymenobacter sp. BT523]